MMMDSSVGGRGRIGLSYIVLSYSIPHQDWMGKDFPHPSYGRTILYPALHS